MSKKRTLPFWMFPGSWGLTGKVYEEAAAYYYLEGEKLEKRLLEIKYDSDSKALALALLAIDLKYHRINPYNYDVKVWEIENDKEISVEAKARIDFKHGKITELELDKILVETNFTEGVERNEAILDMMYKHRKISKDEYDKEVATLHEKPWIGIIDQGFDQELGVNGVYFEFDWNSHWIDYLRLNGYVGHSEEEIVEQWFQDVCRATALNNAGASSTEQDMLLPLAGRAGRHNGAGASARTQTIRRDNGTFYS